MLLSINAFVTDITRIESTGLDSHMARKRHRLKILAALTPDERRVSRPEFRPDGPKHALRRAIKILGPFPTAPAKLQTIDVRDGIFFDTEEEAANRCQEIGEGYFANLVEEQTAPRLPEVLKNFETIRNASKTLAEALSRLSYAERYLLQALWGIHPPELQERLNDHLEEMGEYGPPDRYDITEDNKLAPGALADALNRLGTYVGTLKSIIERRYARKDTRKVDLGGWTNASNIVAPNPRWHLIHEAHEIFSRMEGRAVKLSEGNELQRFVASIHEWITGEADSSFETPIKQYHEVRNRRDAAVERLEVLRTSGKNYSANEFDRAVEFGDRAIPSKILADAKKITAEIENLSSTMEHGHRIPARSLVTG